MNRADDDDAESIEGEHMRCTWQNEDGTCCGRRVAARHYDWLHRRGRRVYVLCEQHDRRFSPRLQSVGYERYAT